MAKVLALGGAGFIGSYAVRELLNHNYEVTIVDNFSKYGYIDHDFYRNPGCKLITKDVRNLYPVDFRGFDYVLCLAALIGGIKYFNRIPYQISRDNTEILSKAIDCTLAASPKATLLYFSSSMVYERMTRPVTEEDALNQPVPLTNYGMQKLFGEFMMRGANKEYGLNYLIVRPFNAVGSGELPECSKDGQVEFGMAHVIPDFIYKSLIKQTPFEIFGEGNQVRTFTHARDIAEAVRIMLDKGVKNDDFNICGESTNKMDDLAKIIWANVNPKIEFPGFKHLPAPSTDVQFRIGKSEKARRILGWQPKHNLDNIIQDSLSFIKHWAEQKS